MGCEGGRTIWCCASALSWQFGPQQCAVNPSAGIICWWSNFFYLYFLFSKQWSPPSAIVHGLGLTGAPLVERDGEWGKQEKGHWGGSDQPHCFFVI